MDSFTWQIAPFDWALAEQLATQLDIPLVLGVVLARRGFTTPEDARAFLDVDPVVPDPFLLHDMEAAVFELDRAVDQGERVVIHGDYDVDGISATALMMQGLKDLGLEVAPFLPSRFIQGYGLSGRAVEDIAAAGTKLLVTVDCGVNYPEEVALARRLGLRVVVTDHHQPGEILPDCPVVHAALSAYPGSQLCGVGVALKLLHALHVKRNGASRTQLPESLVRHLDLVALGTIADIVPLLGENRYYVREGLRRISWERRPGLRALLRVASSETKVDSSTVAYRLAPRLNAAGRLGDPQKPLRLLLTEDEAEATQLAEELDQLNRQRQEVEGRILREALEQADALSPVPSVLVLSGQGWHEGVVGIVASRLVERFNRPTFLLAVNDGVAKGSGRSIPAYDLMAGLKASEDLLTVYGGHRQAAGLTLSATKVAELAHRLDQHAAQILRPGDLVRVYSPDAVVSGSELTLETAEALARLAPFGAGNPPVRLLALGARLENLDTTRTGDHLRCQVVVDGIRTRGIGFGLGKKVPLLREHMSGVHAGIRLEVSEWQGTARTELHVHSVYRLPSNGEKHLGCSPACPFLDPLDALPPCEACSDPYRGSGSSDQPPGRDLRRRGQQLTTVGKVLSSGQPACIVGVSVAHRMPTVASRLPLAALGVDGVDCVSRLCWRTRLSELRPEALLFVDWIAAERRSELLRSKRHLIVVDPPYRPEQVALLHDMESSGVRVHLCYGDTEREFAASYLRFLIHPRFWMVNLYRARQTGAAGNEAFQEAARVGWETQEVLPSAEDLEKARQILMSLGHWEETLDACAAGGGGHARKAEDVPAYKAAEAAYKEARRMCLTM